MKNVLDEILNSENYESVTISLIDNNKYVFPSDDTKILLLDNCFKLTQYEENNNDEYGRFEPKNRTIDFIYPYSSIQEVKAVTSYEY